MSQREKQTKAGAEAPKDLAQRGDERIASPNPRTVYGISGSVSRSANPVRIAVRATPEKKAWLQRAASVSHKSVSEFLLEAGMNAADEALIDQRSFKLDEDQWKAFQEVLSRPVARKPRLARLLAEKSVLE